VVGFSASELERRHGSKFVYEVLDRLVGRGLVRRVAGGRGRVYYYVT